MEEQKRKITNRRSAIYSLTGYIFEVDAAIHLYLKHIKECAFIDIEGNNDISLSLRNKDDLIAQAKAGTTSNEINEKQHFEDIYKAIDSFDESSKKASIKSFIIIFNFRKPFGQNFPSFQNDVDQVYSFDDLPVEVKNKVATYYEKKNYKFGLNKIKFSFVKYECDNQNSFIVSEVRDFVTTDINVNGIDIPSRSVFNAWRSMLINNGCSNDFMLSSTVMAGTVFNLVARTMNLKNILEEIENELAFSDERQVENNIKDLFEKETISIFDYLKIKSEYFQFVKRNKGMLVLLNGIKILYISNINCKLITFIILCSTFLIISEIKNGCSNRF